MSSEKKMVEYAFRVLYSTKAKYDEGMTLFSEHTYRSKARAYLIEHLKIPSSLSAEVQDERLAYFKKKLEDNPRMTMAEIFQPPPIRKIRISSKFSDEWTELIIASVGEINGIITTYNEALQNNDTQRATSLLNKINEVYEKILNKFEPEICAKYPDFYTSLHQEFYPSFLAHLQSGTTPSNLKTCSIESLNRWSSILREMSFEKANELGRILFVNKIDSAREKLPILFPPGDSLHQFFLTHSITLLSRSSNSVNYCIHSTDPGQPPFIIKIEDRIGIPYEASIELGKSMPGLITETSERRAVNIDEGVDRWIVGIEYCPNSDLHHHSIRFRANSTEKMKQATHFYLKMATIFQEMARNGFIMTDSKNPNWLIDGKNEIRIADNKSICYIQDGVLDTAHPKNFPYAPIIQSKGWRPKEVNDEQINVEKFNAYMLGINLYQYLTSCDESVLRPQDAEPLEGLEHKPLSFDHLIFETPQGAMFKSLIEGLIKDEPDERINLSVAIEQLKSIETALNPAVSMREALRQMHAADAPTPIPTPPASGHGPS